MKLNTMALAKAGGLLWGGLVLVVGLANLVWPSYGMAFLEMAASVYPGYSAGAGFGSVVVGTLYGVLDGAIAGFLVGWLYNLFGEAKP